MDEERKFYRVTRDPYDAPIKDYLEHGYSDRRDFYRAVYYLVERWRDRVGEAVGERHGFLLLRFHDTPGGKPDEAWLPMYLLKPAEMPEYLKTDGSEEDDELTRELDEAYGFD